MNLVTLVLSRAAGGDALIGQLGSVRVESMNDGGMGSVRFEPAGTAQPRIGRTIAEAEFRDEDGIAVFVALNLDQDGNLFELDLWKADFSRLKRWPRSEEVIVKQ